MGHRALPAGPASMMQDAVHVLVGVFPAAAVDQ